MDSDIINFIKKWVPYLSGIIVVGGFLYLIFFYLTFGIEIAQYIDLSDCLLLRLDKFMYFLFFVGLCYLIVLLEYTVTISSNADTGAVGEKAKMGTLKPRLFNRDYLPLYSVLFFVYNMYWVEKSTTVIMYLAGNIFAVTLFFLTIAVIKKYSFQNDPGANRKTGFSDPLMIRLAFLSFAYMAFLGFSNANLVNERFSKATEKFSMTLKSHEVLNSSDSLAYVGKIKNYYFLYNPQSDSKIIVSADEVMRFDMTSIPRRNECDTCACLVFLP